MFKSELMSQMHWFLTVSSFILLLLIQMIANNSVHENRSKSGLKTVIKCLIKMITQEIAMSSIKKARIETTAILQWPINYSFFYHFLLCRVEFANMLLIDVKQKWLVYTYIYILYVLFHSFVNAF